jgi:xanthine dehydrogenase accessory factor
MTQQYNENRVVVRGAGDVASGVIRRLFHGGYQVIALERYDPSCVRRLVCYAEAVYDKTVTVEGVTAELADSAETAMELSAKKKIPILVDPLAESLHDLKPLAVVDARLLKKDIDTRPDMAPIVVGLGPGFVAGQNCHAAVETIRGFDLGRVIYNGSPIADTGEPVAVNGFSYDRVLRSPADGEFVSSMKITDMVTAGQVVGQVSGVDVVTQIDGIIRGLIRNGSKVYTSQKIGDVDPRGVKDYCYKISDKANAVGGGVLEALMVLKTHQMIDSPDEQPLN